jgi:flagellar biosynthesis protein FlhA
MQHELQLTDAAQNYTLLSIGDGLVAQIPALLLSTAAAILVTRNTGDEQVGDQIRNQLLAHPYTLLVSGGVLTFLGLIPGMPHMAFILLGGLMLGFYYLKNRVRFLGKMSVLSIALVLKLVIV